MSAVSVTSSTSLYADSKGTNSISLSLTRALTMPGPDTLSDTPAPAGMRPDSRSAPYPFQHGQIEFAFQPAQFNNGKMLAGMIRPCSLGMRTRAS